MFEYILSIIGIVIGGVICHYTIKWLAVPKTTNSLNKKATRWSWSLFSMLEILSIICLKTV